VLNSKLNEIKKAVVFIDQEAKVLVLDYDKKKLEIKNLISGYKKYQKDNPEVAKQIQGIVKSKISEIKVFENKLKEIEKKQSELRKKLMNVFSNTETNKAAKPIVQKEKRATPEAKKIIKVSKLPHTKIAARPVIKTVKKAEPKKEHSPKISTPNLRQQAQEAQKAQDQLAALATGRSFGNA